MKRREEKVVKKVNINNKMKAALANAGKVVLRKLMSKPYFLIITKIIN